jgi:hypothetical protein
MAHGAEPFVLSSMFYLQSKFDHFQLEAIVGLDCMNRQSYVPPFIKPNCTTAEIATIQSFGLDYYSELASNLLASPGATRGLYLSSCIIHGQTGAAWTTTVVNGSTPQQAFSDWYWGKASSTSKNGKWVESCKMPCNTNTKVCAPYA